MLEPHASQAATQTLFLMSCAAHLHRVNEKYGLTAQPTPAAPVPAPDLAPAPVSVPVEPTAAAPVVQESAAPVAEETAAQLTSAGQGFDLASAFHLSPPAAFASDLPLDGGTLVDPAVFQTTLDSVAFGAIADGGSPLPTLFATVLSAVVGALFFEYMATAAMPLGPGSGSIGGAFRAAGKLTDVVAMKVWELLRPVRQSLPF